MMVNSLTTISHRLEEKQALRYHCPVCGVAPGTKCKALGRYSGQNTRYAHAERNTAHPEKLNPKRAQFAFSDLLDIKD